jgi:hypothetical protein
MSNQPDRLAELRDKAQEILASPIPVGEQNKSTFHCSLGAKQRVREETRVLQQYSDALIAEGRMPNRENKPVRRRRKTSERGGN